MMVVPAAGTGLLVVLTVVEAALLVAVLAVFLVLIARRLKAINHNLRRFAEDDPRVERHRGSLATAGVELSEALERLRGDLPDIAGAAEELARRG